MKNFKYNNYKCLFNIKTLRYNFKKILNNNYIYFILKKNFKYKIYY